MTVSLVWLIVFFLHRSVYSLFGGEIVLVFQISPRGLSGDCAENRHFSCRKRYTPLGSNGGSEGGWEADLCGVLKFFRMCQLA